MATEKTILIAEPIELLSSKLQPFLADVGITLIKLKTLKETLMTLQNRSVDVLLLDSSRIDVLPLAGRSFHYKPLASTGDFDAGEIIGEYTLELRNQSAHGMITGLDVS